MRGVAVADERDRRPRIPARHAEFADGEWLRRSDLAGRVGPVPSRDWRRHHTQPQLRVAAGMLAIARRSSETGWLGGDDSVRGTVVGPDLSLHVGGAPGRDSDQDSGARRGGAERPAGATGGQDRAATDRVLDGHLREPSGKDGEHGDDKPSFGADVCVEGEWREY